MRLEVNKEKVQKLMDNVDLAVRIPDPMGDSCCRERLSRPGVKVGNHDPPLFQWICEVCNKSWLQREGSPLPPTTLTSFAKDILYGGIPMEVKHDFIDKDGNPHPWVRKKYIRS